MFKSKRNLKFPTIDEQQLSEQKLSDTLIVEHL
jgi:hypothetical protein